MKLVLQIALGIVLAPLVLLLLIGSLGAVLVAGKPVILSILLGVGIWLGQKPVLHYLNARRARIEQIEDGT